MSMGAGIAVAAIWISTAVVARTYRDQLSGFGAFTLLVVAGIATGTLFGK